LGAGLGATKEGKISTSFEVFRCPFPRVNVQLGVITAVIRILVVDDHDATRRSLSSFLAHEDKFTVCGEAADGVQAIEQARNLSPDAIVMDASMAKMDGLSAARII